MNQNELAESISDEIDALDIHFFNKIEIEDTVNTIENGQVLIYSITDGNAIIPYFKTMAKANATDSLM